MAGYGEIIFFVCTTFAWFTSTDEVTNRLSAKGDYNVTTYENFTPPENLSPGQTVTKEVSVVNTGNISAFVEVELSGLFNGVYYGSSSTNSSLGDNTTLSKITDENERKALQSGGKLIYTNASSSTQKGVDGKTDVKDANGTKIVDVDSDDFTPATDGVYIFKRHYDTDGQATTDTDKFAGYYKSGTDYYRINATGASAFTYVTEVTVTNLAATADYTKTNTTDKAVEFKGTLGTNTVTFTVELDNLGDGTVADLWQYVANKGFYYTDDLDPGEKTVDLVKSVKFEDTTAKFKTLDFDLNVTTKSSQVVTLADGTEVVPTGTAANSAGTVAGVNDGYATTANTGIEITQISWTASAPAPGGGS